MAKKQVGRKPGGSYDVYKRDYRIMAKKYKGKIELSKMYTKSEYQIKYANQKHFMLTRPGISKSTVPNVNRSLIQEQLHDTGDEMLTRAEARAIQKAIKTRTGKQLTQVEILAGQKLVNTKKTNLVRDFISERNEAWRLGATGTELSLWFHNSDPTVKGLKRDGKPRDYESFLGGRVLTEDDFEDAAD